MCVCVTRCVGEGPGQVNGGVCVRAHVIVCVCRVGWGEGGGRDKHMIHTSMHTHWHHTAVAVIDWAGRHLGGALAHVLCRASVPCRPASLHATTHDCTSINRAWQLRHAFAGCNPSQPLQMGGDIKKVPGSHDHHR